MKKLFSFVMMTLVGLMAYAQTETTVYYTAPASEIGTYTVKLNVNFKGDGDDWQQMDMSKTELKNGEDPVYSCKFTDKYNGLGVMQFQLYDGETWKSQKVAFEEWTTVATYNGKMYVHATGTWVAAPGEGGGETPDPEAAKFYVTGDSALVVDAGLDKGKAWNADAIKSTKDTAVLNLKANQYYRLKVVVGTNWLGYDKLTEAAEGLEDLTTDNHNIGFKLNNAGEVKVIYFVKDAQVTFKLLGDFQVAAAPKMEIAGGWDEWTKHDMTLSGDNKTAVYELNLTTGDYNFKLIKDGAWISKANDGAPFGLHRDFPGVAGVKDVDSDNLKLTADVDGKYIFTFTFENDSLGITFPEKGDVPPVGPELADGFYLIGQNGWDVAALSASLKFEKNLGAENEYQLSVTLVEGQPIKVVYVENNAIKDWYPVGEGNEYVVAAEHAGNKIIYFNPSKNGEWSLLDGYIYIADGGETAITNTADGIKAVKVLRDGQILIIKGEKTFNVQGQIVR